MAIPCIGGCRCATGAATPPSSSTGDTALLVGAGPDGSPGSGPEAHPSFLSGPTATAGPGERVATARARFEDLHRARFGFISPETDADRGGGPGGGRRSGRRRRRRARPISGPSTTGPSADGRNGETARLGVTHPGVDGRAPTTTPRSSTGRGLAARRSRSGGPAVIVEATATTVVEPGWAATLTDAGRPGAGAGRGPARLGWPSMRPTSGRGVPSMRYGSRCSTTCS